MGDRGGGGDGGGDGGPMGGQRGPAQAGTWSTPGPQLPLPTLCITWSSSRRHCTSFFRYWSSFSLTRSST